MSSASDLRSGKTHRDENFPVASWIIFGVARLAGLDVPFHRIVEVLYSAAVVAGLYGVFNASWTRITRTTVRLANLPEAWRGRTAALISDVHLGHVRNGSFLRRVVAKILRDEPDAVFIAGDLYDGTAIDAGRAAEPLNQLTAPHGVYFVAGNHEQFGDDSKYLHAVSAAGVRVLSNEKVEVDGLQIIGVPYSHATREEHLASVLRGVRVDRNRASILLIHAPDHPAKAEAAGVSLQLSGHTHVGQLGLLRLGLPHTVVSALSKIQDSIEVVVVLPCVPPTTRTSLPRRNSSCRICGSEQNGIRWSRMCSSSTLPREMALPTTTMSGRGARFAAAKGCATGMLSEARKSDMGG